MVMTRPLHSCTSWEPGHAQKKSCSLVSSTNSIVHFGFFIFSEENIRSWLVSTLGVFLTGK